MFVDFKFSTMKEQVRAYWNPMQNLVFQFSVADSHFAEPVLKWVVTVIFRILCYSIAAIPIILGKIV